MVRLSSCAYRDCKYVMYLYGEIIGTSEHGVKIAANEH